MELYGRLSDAYMLDYAERNLCHDNHFLDNRNDLLGLFYGAGVATGYLFVGWFGHLIFYWGGATYM